MSTIDDVNKYLRDKEPDVMGLVETKLNEDVIVPKIGDGKYKLWKRNRLGKKGGGIMFIVKSDIIIDNIIMGENKAEVLKISVKLKHNKQRDFAIAYVPPKTNAWTGDEYEGMLSETLECLEGVIENSNNLILMGDFNCKEVCWEQWYTDGGEESWGQNYYIWRWKTR